MNKERKLMSKVVSEIVETRLEQWARWYARCLDGGVGYDSVSASGKLIEGDSLIQRNKSISYTASDMTAREVHRIIQQLEANYPQRAHALYLEYFSPANLQKKAEHLGLSRSQYVWYRDLAKVWIEGRLG